jgi:hypothetical protein
MTGTADSTSAGDRLGIVLGANDGSNTLSAGRVGNVSPSKAIANQSGVGIYISMLDYAPQAATVTSKTNTFSGGTATNWGILADFLAVPSTNTNTGSITTTLTKASIAGVGAMYPKGTIATNLTKASMSASGAMYPKGTISTALTKASMSAAGKVSPIGTIATVLQKVSQRLQGSGVNSGTVTTSLTKASFSLVGKASIKARSSLRSSRRVSR